MCGCGGEREIVSVLSVECVCVGDVLDARDLEVHVDVVLRQSSGFRVFTVA